MTAAETRHNATGATHTVCMPCRLCHRIRILSEDRTCAQCAFLLDEFTETLFLDLPPKRRRAYAEDMVYEPPF